MYNSVVRADGYLWNSGQTGRSSNNSTLISAVERIAGEYLRNVSGTSSPKRWNALRQLVEADQHAMAILDAAKQLTEKTPAQFGKGRRKQENGVRTKQQAMLRERKSVKEPVPLVKPKFKRGRPREKPMDFRPATWKHPFR